MQNHTTQGGYAELLAHGGFQGFLWTQFLVAFNDNVFKMMVSVAAVHLAADATEGTRWLSLAGAVFVLPFLLFAGWAGQLADRFSKTHVLVVTKACEILIMIAAAFALHAGSIGGMLAVLFLLAAQANFFSPAKYGLLPEMLPEHQLMRANGLLELSTFVAIVAGGACGPLLYEHFKHDLGQLGLVLIGLAVIGTLTSLKIPKMPASGARQAFRWNPFGEIATGWNHIRGNRTMLIVVFGNTYFWFVGALLQMILVLYGQKTLALDESGAGGLVAALAIGIGIGSILAGRLSGDHIELGMVPPAGVGLALAAFGLATAGSFGTALGWLAGMGIAAGLFAVPLNAWIQEEAAPIEKGRILATNNFVNMIGVILASGSLWIMEEAFRLSPVQILLAAGVLTLLFSVAAIWFFPLAALRFVCWCILHTLFKVRVIGGEKLPKTSGALVVANHVSYADGFLIASATPRYIRFLLWKPIFDIPYLKPFFQMLKLIPIAANGRRESLEALIKARKELETGELVGIFPEGQITRTSHLLPFRKGYERIVEGKDGRLLAPIIPVWIEGLWGHPLSMKGGKLFSSFRNVWRPQITVIFGDPIHEPIGPEALQQKVAELGTQASRITAQESGTLVERFVRQAKQHWDSTAVTDSTGKKLTYAETLVGARLMGGWIAANAAGQEKIGILLPTSVAGVLANLGTAFAGRCAVNLNFTAGEEHIASAVGQCGLRTIITSRAFLEKVKMDAQPGMVFMEEIAAGFTASMKRAAYLKARLLPVNWQLPAGVKPDTLAAIIFSSGSTGEPKGVMLSHANLMANCDAVAQVYSFTSKDVMLGVLPLFHSFGYVYNLWFPLLSGAQSAYHPNPTDAKTIGELAAEHKATFLLATPTFCLGFIRKVTKEQFATLRYALVGAEKLRPAVAEAFTEKFGVPIYEGYGCTEMAPVVAVNGPDFNDASSKQLGNKPGTVGRPIPGVNVRIVDPETHAPREAGEEGLLLVDGASRMLGYLGQPEKTAKAMVDGYYVTGDIARLDADGFITITDRLARFSKIGGEMVPHLKVEEALRPALGDAAVLVVGVPDDSRGERLAVLHTHPTVEPATLVARLNEEGLPALWIPKRDAFFRVESIPTLGTGKTDLRKAKEMIVSMAPVER